MYTGTVNTETLASALTVIYLVGRVQDRNQSIDEETMPTRREFLKSVSGPTAGIVFADCCCADSSLGFAVSLQQPAPHPAAKRKRREVFVGGHRVKVVDIHAHVRVPEAWDLVKDRIGREGRAGDAQQANPNNLQHKQCRKASRGFG